MNYSSTNRIILYIFIIILFYAGIILYSDFSKILSVTKNFNWIFTPIIIIVVLFSLFLRSLIQRIFLNALTINLSLKENFYLFLSSFSMMITPGGIGMVIKSHFLKNKYGHSISKTFPIVLFERLNDLIIIMCILSVFSIFYFRFEIIMALFVGFIMITLILFSLKTKKLSKFLTLLQRKFTFIKLETLDSNEFEQTTEKFMKFQIMTRSLILTFISTSLEAIAVILCFHGFGIEIVDLKIIQSYFASIFFGALSFIPGGLGIVEGSFIGLLISQGFESSYAATIVIFVRVFLLWMGVYIGFLLASKFLKNNSK